MNLDELNRQNNYELIDIRDNYSYSLGHLPKAKNIPYYNLLGNFSHYLNKNNYYILYCDYGKQSKEISDKLNSFGYNTTSLKGGYLGYKNK